MANDFVTVSTVNAIHVMELHLPDGIDSSEFDRLNEELSALFEGHAGLKWVLDLAGVEYLGSAALGLMVNIRQKVKAKQGRLALCNLSAELMKIFRTCCLERLFTIAKTRGDALKAVR